MALSKKPVKTTPVVSEDIVEALINKGGSVPATIMVENTVAEKAQKKVLKGGQVPVQLRLSPEILDVIDGLIAKKLIPSSRHAWFMNAIVEQIKREQEG
jgi:hypothetical protein